jgi:hypothetical protein
LLSVGAVTGLAVIVIGLDVLAHAGLPLSVTVPVKVVVLVTATLKSAQSPEVEAGV